MCLRVLGRKLASNSNSHSQVNLNTATAQSSTSQSQHSGLVFIKTIEFLVVLKWRVYA